MPTTISGSGSAEFHTALPVAEGGTGATASTGSGNVVLSASPTLTTALDISTANKSLDTTGNLFIKTTNGQAADLGGTIGLGGVNGAGSYDPWAFATIGGKKANSTSGNYEGYFAIGTPNSGGTISEKMRITSTTDGGNVGIGTTAPDQKLHLAHAGRLGLRVEATTTDIAEVLLKNTTETWGIKNEGGNLVIADESTGIMATMAKDTGVLTLAAPLPVASGGTGATSNAGKVLQVVSATLDTRVSMATTSWQDIGLSAAITPSATSSKILITVSFGRAQTTQSNGDHGAAIRLLRGSVDSDLNGIADGSRSRGLFTVSGRSFNGDHSMGGFGMTGLDSPSTASAVTYKLQAWPQSGSYPLIINGTNSNTDVSQAYTARTKTIITLMEIGG
tara:strand:+ start:949 stop:2121 length:1173 start_codon:yes stop_codon:yes gene_type:complete